MNSNAVLPMESFRLAQYAVEVPCYVCDGGNAFDAELCRHCHAPMALVKQAGKQQQIVAPEVLATLGASGAGKTVYLGMLMDMLSRRQGNIQLSARGAFSISLQQRTMAALSRCEFPEKTPNEPDRWNWVHARAQMKGKHEFDVIMPDMAGEAIVAEADHPTSFPVVRSMLTKATSVLFLFDAYRISEGDSDQDFVAMKVLNYLSELAPAPQLKPKKARRKNSDVVGPKLAIVFTKSDQCDACYENPLQFAEKHIPGVFQLCAERFPSHQFFSTSVAGTCATRRAYSNVRERIPLRVEPRGITEPVEWILEQRSV